MYSRSSTGNTLSQFGSPSSVASTVQAWVWISPSTRCPQRAWMAAMIRNLMCSFCPPGSADKRFRSRCGPWPRLLAGLGEDRVEQDVGAALEVRGGGVLGDVVA